MTRLITWLTRRELCTGSGCSSRTGISARRGTTDHSPCRSCSPAAKTKHRKDAGSVRSRRLRTRLRTRRGAGLQRPGARELCGEGSTSRTSFRAVLGAALAAVADAGRVEAAANHLVAKTRQVADASATNQNDRVLLEVVPFSRDVGADFHPVRQPHAGDLAQGRVRLLGRGRIDTCTDTALLGRAAKRRRLHPRLRRGPALAHELIHGRHCCSISRGKGLRHNKGWPGGKPLPTGQAW